MKVQKLGGLAAAVFVPPLGVATWLILSRGLDVSTGYDWYATSLSTVLGAGLLWSGRPAGSRRVLEVLVYVPIAFIALVLFGFLFVGLVFGLWL